MDILGNILGSMEKPPSVNTEERKKAKEQQKQLERIQQYEKDKLNHFKCKIQKDVQKFVKDAASKKMKFPAMEKTYRGVVHDVAEVAGLVAFSFGEDGVDRYITLWKKEFAPGDDELATLRKGEEWTEEKAKQLAAERALAEEAKKCQSTSDKVVPASNYQDKYKHLIGKDAGKHAANSTMTNRSYGLVSSENKRDLRTIEEVLAENKAKKKQKTEHKKEMDDKQSETMLDEEHIQKL